MQYPLFISCPKGFEYLVETELKSLELPIQRVTPQGVFCTTTLTGLYRTCLWARVANRVQLVLFSGSADNESSVQQLCLNFPWQTVFSVDKTFTISFHGTNTHIRNTMYGAQLVKDGIVDHFRKMTQTRPSVARTGADIHLQAHLKDNILTVSLDLVGASLHQRGYRKETGEAPIKENVAAALLMRAQWATLCEQGYAFDDPCCGAGTFVIEAAMMAAKIAPGLLREQYAFSHWVDHDEALWQRTRQEALSCVQPVNVKLVGSDPSPDLIRMAKVNAERAGVSKLVSFETKALRDSKAVSPQGLLMCNPPYGERLGEIAPLLGLYESLGQVLSEHYVGWQAAVLTSNPILAKAIGLRSHKQYVAYNGKIACQLYLFQLNASNRYKGVEAAQPDSGMGMIVNRLSKNEAHLAKWAKRIGVNAYRLYDADLPEYACAVDRYSDYVVVQEYVAPKSIPEALASKRRATMMQAVGHVLKVPTDKIVFKQRRQQKGLNQYEKLDQKRERILVQEGAAKFWVNLHDYVDTGLFLDHRPLRFLLGKISANKRFLNLFCYTATASVHAALTGATTTNVDLSKTYLMWAQANFQANGLNPARHQFLSFDVKRWLTLCKHQYDVIFLDPPTFSNSKRMEDELDVQRDHVRLIDASMALLAPGGVLYFSTNLKRFQLDDALKERYNVQEISKQSIDEDFKRHPKIHQCYKLTLH